MRGVSAQRHYTRLPTLGKSQVHRPFAKVHVLICHAFKLADSHARPIEHFQQRAVPEDVAHKEIVLPSHLAESADMEWAQNRSTLWNAAEHAGSQRNARLARELLVILPHELTL